MKQLFWFILGVVLTVAGQSLAQSWSTQPNGASTYQQQTETNTLNNFNNYLNNQQMQQYQNQFSGKSPC